MKHHTPSPPIKSSTKSTSSYVREVIGERTGKILYNSEKPEFIIQEFKTNGLDEGKTRQNSKQLSTLRNEMSCYLFEYLEGFHIPTHYVKRLTDTEMMVKKIDIIPLHVKIYNVVSTQLSKRFGYKEGTILQFPVFEHFFENGHTTSWANEYHLYAFDLMSPDEYKHINRISSKVNAIIRALCDRRQLLLAALQLEFGRYKGQIVLGDELSYTTCHFIDVSVEAKHQRERFLLDDNNNGESVLELRDRLKLTF